MNTCASARVRDPGDQVDVKQHLINIQMTISQIRGSVSGLENKIDAIGLGMSSIRQELVTASGKENSNGNGPSPLEFDDLLKKHIQGALALSNGDANLRIESDQVVSVAHQMESLKRVEQGVNELMTRTMGAGVQENKLMSSAGGYTVERERIQFGGGGPTPHASADNPAAPDYMASEARIHLKEELLTFQMALLNEFKTQQEVFVQFKSQQDTLVNEFQHFAKVSPQVPQVPEEPRQPAKDGASRIGTDYNALEFGEAERQFEFGPLNPAGGDEAALDSVQNDRDRAPSSLSDHMMAAVQSGNASAADLAHLEDLADKDEKEAKPEPCETDPLADDDTIDDGPIILNEAGSLASVFMTDGDVEAVPYNVEDFFWKTGICQSIARTNLFANITVLIVIINAVYIGFDSDYNNAQNIYEADAVFQIFSQFFCIFFSWELGIRFFAFEIKHSCLKDGWFKFDAFLVSTMILDIWLLMPVLYVIGGGIMVPTQPLRMLRLFKLTRMARLMKAFPELVTMIKGLVRSLRAISSSMILIGLMVYVWAIMMHMLMKEEKEFNEQLWQDNMLSFETITKCIWTLLMDGTLMLDNAAPLMTTLLFSDKPSWVLAGFIFLSYAMLSALLILQMLIGVLCDVVSRVGQEQRDATAIGLVKQEILADLQEFDGGDGRISQEELFKVMNNPGSKRVLKKLKINRGFLMEMQKMMFTRPGQQVSIKSILELMIMCRGENAVTVESMAGGLLSIINEVVGIKESLDKDIHTEVLSIKIALEKDMRQMEAHIKRQGSQVVLGNGVGSTAV